MVERRAHALLIAFLASEHPGRAHRRKDDGLDPAAVLVWRERAEPVAVELYRYRETLALVSKRYFDGRELLFPAVRADLNLFIAGVKELVSIYNEEVASAGHGRKPGRGRGDSLEPIDPARLLALGRREAVGEAARVVDAAKLEALQIMGEQDQANALLDRRFWPGVERAG